MLAAPEHQEMNGQAEVTRRTLRTTEQSIMVHARVLEACINFALMYTTDHIFLYTHGKNNTRKCYIEGFVPVASLCGVVV